MVKKKEKLREMLDIYKFTIPNEEEEERVFDMLDNGEDVLYYKKDDEKLYKLLRELT